MKSYKKTILGTGAMLAFIMAGSASATEINDYKNDDLDEPRGRAEFLRSGKPEKPEMMRKNNLKTEDIAKALSTNDFALFTTTLKNAGFTETVTEANFKIIIEAYTKAKAGDVKGAQELLKTNNITPMMERFIMGQHNKIDLTDAQKSTLKQAKELMEQGKKDEAEALIKTAGLPLPMKGEMNQEHKEMKEALEKAKELRKEGKKDEAKEVLKQAGVTAKTQKKLEREFKSQEIKTKGGLLGQLKKFFSN